MAREAAPKQRSWQDPRGISFPTEDKEGQLRSDEKDVEESDKWRRDHRGDTGQARKQSPAGHTVGATCGKVQDLGQAVGTTYGKGKRGAWALKRPI